MPTTSRAVPRPPGARIPVSRGYDAGGAYPLTHGATFATHPGAEARNLLRTRSTKYPCFARGVANATEWHAGSIDGGHHDQQRSSAPRLAFNPRPASTPWTAPGAGRASSPTAAGRGSPRRTTVIDTAAATPIRGERPYTLPASADSTRHAFTPPSRPSDTYGDDDDGPPPLQPLPRRLTLRPRGRGPLATCAARPCPAPSAGPRRRRRHRAELAAHYDDERIDLAEYAPGDHTAIAEVDVYA